MSEKFSNGTKNPEQNKPVSCDVCAIASDVYSMSCNVYSMSCDVCAIACNVSI